MSLTYSHINCKVVPYKKGYTIFGDTKPFKDYLKEFGCKFNGTRWIFNENIFEFIDEYIRAKDREARRKINSEIKN